MPRFNTKILYFVVIAMILIPVAVYWAARSYVSLAAFARAPATDIASLKVPDGYELNFFAPPNSGLQSPRQLAEGADGWIFAGSRGDKVYALRDENGDGVAEDVRVVAAGMDTPHGVAFADGDLYVGAVDGVYVIRNVAAKLAGGDARPQLFVGGLPENSWHGTRHLGIGADGMLYVSLGTPCNVCIPPDAELTGVIRRYPLPDGGAGEVFARGIRNSVGFDFHPADGALWFTDNGRDWLGDDLPGDELNRAPRAGMHFGFPYCHQGDLPDPEFGGESGCDGYEKPVLLTGAHVANLGMAFDDNGKYVYIALHGSWNRSVKTGYAVYRAAVRADGGVSGYAPFLEGWLRADESVSGRPADVIFTEDGDLLVSDDFAHAVYRARKIS
ncbi:MAG: PQQ-dependent sugar dehydrogenase [Gammaproteobacteria bacterium]